MEAANFGFTVAGGILTLVAGVFFATHRDLGIWTSAVAAICLILSGACWWQDRVWKADAAATATTPTAAIPSATDIAAEVGKQLPIARGVLAPVSGDAPLMDDARKSRDDIPDDATGVLLGASQLYVRSFPLVIAQQGDEDVIVLDKTDKGLELTAKFFDENGDIICQIVKNEFDMNTNKGNYSFVRQPTPNSLVVQNHQGGEVCNIHYDDNRTIRFTGKFCLEDGNRLIIGPDYMTYANKSVQISGVVMPINTRITVLALPPVLKGFSEENVTRKGVAYLSTQSPIKVNIAVGTPITFQIPIKNLGDVSAKLTKRQVYCTMDRREARFSEVLANFKKTSVVPLEAPEVTPGLVFPIDYTLDLATEEAVTVIQNGTVILRLFGKVLYEDGRGNVGVVWFCGQYDPKTKTIVPDRECVGL